MSGELDQASQAAPMPTAEDMEKPMDMEMDMDKGMDMDPMMMQQMHEAQIAFTVISLMGAVGSGLMAFRYQPTSVYTAAATAFGGNMYKYIDQVHTYGTFAFWTVAAIFQLLSWASVATDINLMVWMYGGEAGFFMTLMWMAEMWYYKSQAATNIAAGTNATENQQVLEHIEMTMAHVSAGEAAIGLETMMKGEAWGMAQWMMMSKEKQDAMSGEGADMKEMDEDMKEEMKDEEQVQTDSQDPKLFAIWKMLHF